MDATMKNGGSSLEQDDMYWGKYFTQIQIIHILKVWPFAFYNSSSDSDFVEDGDDIKFGRVVKRTEIQEIRFRRFMEKIKRRHKRLLHGSDVGNRVGRFRQRYIHCSKCGLTGHNMRTCPGEKPHCKRCWRLGHETISCADKKNDANVPSSLENAGRD